MTDKLMNINEHLINYVCSGLLYSKCLKWWQESTSECSQIKCPLKKAHNRFYTNFCSLIKKFEKTLISLPCGEKKKSYKMETDTRTPRLLINIWSDALQLLASIMTNQQFIHSFSAFPHDLYPSTLHSTGTVTSWTRTRGWSQKFGFIYYPNDVPTVMVSHCSLPWFDPWGNSAILEFSCTLQRG